MTSDERAALQMALRATERAADALRAVLATPVEPNDLMPLSEACRHWGLSKDAGRKKARRGAGRKIAGRWCVPAANL